MIGGTIASIRLGPGSASDRSSCCGEVLGGLGAGGRDAESLRERDEVDVGTVEVEHLLRLRTRLGADSVELHVEDRVRAVVVEHGRDVESLARLGPQRLDRVERTAVGLERDRHGDRARRRPLRSRPADPDRWRRR